MTERLARLAAGGKLVLALEGGYNLRMTAECGAESVKVCAECKCGLVNHRRHLTSAVVHLHGTMPQLLPVREASDWQVLWLPFR